MVATLNDLKLAKWFRDYQKGTLTWQTKEGVVIPVKDMTDSHLTNTIAYLERKEVEEETYYEALSSIGDAFSI